MIVKTIVTIGMAISISLSGYTAPAGPRNTENPAIIDGTEILSLSDAVCFALRYHSGLIQARNDLKQFELEAMISRSWPSPELSVETENILGKGSLRQFNAMENTFQISQEIPLGKQRSSGIAVSNAETDLARKEYELLRNEVIESVYSAYILALESRELAALAFKLKELSEIVTQVVQSRADAGKISPVEASRASLSLMQASIHQQEADSAYRSQLRNLLSLTGIPCDDYPQLAKEIPDLPVSIPETGIPGKIAPLLERFDCELALRQTTILAARSERWPRLALSGGYRWFEESGERAYTAGFSLQFPSFRKSSGTLQKALVMLDKTREAQRSERHQLELELETLREEMGTSLISHRLLKETLLGKAEQVFEDTREGFKYGKFDYLEVLDSQRTLFDIQLQTVRYATRAHLNLARLAALTGNLGLILNEECHDE